MIQKYTPKLINATFPKTVGTVMFPDSYGEYVRYSDYLKKIEDLNQLLLKKEQELTNVSDRLNKKYLSERAN